LYIVGCKKKVTTTNPSSTKGISKLRVKVKVECAIPLKTTGLSTTLVLQLVLEK